MVYDKLVEKAVFHVATSSDVGNRAGGKRPHVWFAPLIVGHIIIMSEENSLENDTVIGEPVLLSLRLRLNVSRSIFCASVPLLFVPGEWWLVLQVVQVNPLVRR